MAAVPWHVSKPGCRGGHEAGTEQRPEHKGGREAGRAQQVRQAPAAPTRPKHRLLHGGLTVACALWVESMLALAAVQQLALPLAGGCREQWAGGGGKNETQ